MTQKEHIEGATNSGLLNLNSAIKKIEKKKGKSKQSGYEKERSLYVLNK